MSHGAKQVYALEAITIEIMELTLNRFLLLPPLVHVPTIGTDGMALPPDPIGMCIFSVVPHTFVKLHQDLSPPR